MKRCKVRSDSWVAKVPLDRMNELYELLDLSFEKASIAIKAKFNVSPSRSSFYRAKEELRKIQYRHLQLIAASTPPALDELNEINRSLDTISSGIQSIKSLLAKRINAEYACPILGKFSDVK